jgi:hypothetical protein
MMAVINFPALVYVVMGIDVNGHDQVIAVRKNFREAKQYCVECLAETEFYDLWIEKHELL